MPSYGAVAPSRMHLLKNIQNYGTTIFILKMVLYIAEKIKRGENQSLNGNDVAYTLMHFMKLIYRTTGL